MAHAYVSIGSNIEPERYIRSSLESLRQQYGKLIISSVYESQAVGFSGNNFYNLVVGFETTDTIPAISQTLRHIEADHGRQRTSEKFNDRTLDLDLILYDDWVGQEGNVVLPRDEIVKYAFVLQPLAEIAPDEKHPQLQQTYADLWQQFDKSQQVLWVIDIPI